MNTTQTFVIVGAGLAGAKAAEELRERGFDGRVLLIGAEAERPYERPPLSKDHLRGESDRAKVFVHDADFYEQHDVELLIDTTVTEVDPGAGTVTLDDGGTIGFDRLLLTTGAEPRRLQIPGSELDGIHYLRSLADCEAIGGRLEAGAHVAVIGAGWIGSEVAASARQRGLAVTLIDPLSLPNERIFGREIGEFYREVHSQHRVELLLGERVESFEGEGSLSRILTASGKTIECDFAVVGVGVTPRLELAQAAGLALDNGIAVDQSLRTSAHSVFAAGDVASVWHPFYESRIRVEHWANALNQGPAAARAMLGHDVSYERIPYFFSDQYEVGMEYSGYAADWDEVVFRGDRDDGEFIAFWVKDRTVVAGMNVNVWDVSDQVQALIRSRQELDLGSLRDPDTPLSSLIPQPARA
jgi:3-phenylpropionate/trans-cinnamate dioxygenase ferredoxin reductase subunit